MLDVGAWFSPEAVGERVPRLTEVLAWNEHMALNLEIKSPHNDPGLAEAVATAVRQASAQRRTLLSCFDRRVVEALAERYDDLQLGYLGQAPVREPHPGIEWQILEANALLDHPQWCAWVRDRRQHLWCWTVDSPQVARRLHQCGVDALITNDPGRMLQTLR